MIFGLLFIIFNFAFIISPYWLLPELPIGKFTVLVVTIISGIIWANYSTGRLQLQYSIKSFAGLVILLSVIFAINLGPLSSSIPWRGDEDFHIANVLALINDLQPYVSIFVLAGFVVFLYLLAKNKGLAFIWYSLIMLVIFWALAVIRILPLGNPVFFPRYPYFTYWITAILLKIPSIIFTPFHEEFYRLVPLLFTGIIIWLFIRVSFKEISVPSFLAGIGVTTIPLVFYYSSIFYLELPAVCLMFVVCLRIDHLLHSDFNEIRNDPAWYALLLLGFIKETTLPFLIVFVIFRFAILFLKLKKSGQNNFDEKQQPEPNPLKRIYAVLGQEVIISLLVLFPAVLYLIFRSSLAEISRGYIPAGNNLLHLSTYKVIIRSLLEQFGPFLVIFLAGCILLIRQKDYIKVCFFLSSIVIFLIFFTADDWKFIGYSRFNLLILPEILACSIAVFHRLKDQKILGPVLSILILAVNLWISPVNSDGTKKPFWGNYNYDTSEHYYPYEETLQWIKDSDIHGSILFTGLYYPYYFEFYFHKLNWFPVYKVIESEENRNEKRDILKMLTIGKEENYTFVIYHILGKDIPTIEKDTGYEHMQEICNMAHCLLVFY
ncbi:hypothetical protein [Leptolinea tardivitalis]|uniref:Glycosyltransferase RgtA/B/C/D-like domain-containing protein n=1 Tax=Leptolinea tardivitalis TaxID=229920 RepID=A0A0P6X7V3_9CHLR|nr:hypothetical protein [Leptolinea tardivitalis]KPL70254.1 hypothetical protein ADM99_13845 [Leptolinea tardivitalis]GAP21802.1 hypothetical protein LTAR_02019 [Leptolinea tardivitalis]